MYDWANSAYVTSVCLQLHMINHSIKPNNSLQAAAVFVGAYLTGITKQESCTEYTSTCTWCEAANACISSILLGEYCDNIKQLTVLQEMNTTMCAPDYCSGTRDQVWCCEETGYVPFGGTMYI